MRPEPKANRRVAAPVIDQANPRVQADARPPQPRPPAPRSLPAAPETAADPRGAHNAATPLRPAQRGLAWLCELLRSQHEE